MTAHNHWHDPILINTIGHTAGVLLFGLIIALLIRDCRTRGMWHTILSLVAAVLAFGWNVGSLIVLAAPEPASPLVGIIMAASFAMLSLLPAVLLQVAAKANTLWLSRQATLSARAACLHFRESFTSGIGLHQAALLVIVIGFGVLTLVTFFLGGRGDSARSDWVSPAEHLRSDRFALSAERSVRDMSGTASVLVPESKAKSVRTGAFRVEAQIPL